MLMARFVVSILSVGMLVLSCGIVCGQAYPNKSIRFVAGNIGSANDYAARLIAQELSGPLGQPVIVDNRSGLMGGELLYKAPPDGYTLHLSGNNLWVGPLIQKVPYDPMTDFSPVMLVANGPKLLVVHPSVPAKSIEELIAVAKAKPGELNYVSSVTGGSGHIAGELFKAMAGVNIVRIAYKGSAAGINDLLAGRVQMIIDDGVTVVPHIKSGKLRALAVTSAEPSALYPGMPTVSASGVPGYESVGTTGMFAPAKTPAAIIRRLNQEVVRVLGKSDVKEKLLTNGQEIVASSPEHLSARMKSERATVSKLIKDGAIRIE